MRTAFFLTESIGGDQEILEVASLLSELSLEHQIGTIVVGIHKMAYQRLNGLAGLPLTQQFQIRPYEWVEMPTKELDDVPEALRLYFSGLIPRDESTDFLDCDAWVIFAKRDSFDQFRLRVNEFQLRPTFVFDSLHPLRLFPQDSPHPDRNLSQYMPHKLASRNISVLEQTTESQSDDHFGFWLKSHKRESLKVSLEILHVLSHGHQSSFILVQEHEDKSYHKLFYISRARVAKFVIDASQIHHDSFCPVENPSDLLNENSWKPCRVNSSIIQSPKSEIEVEAFRRLFTLIKERAE
jgi:hypothetical protein